MPGYLTARMKLRVPESADEKLLDGLLDEAEAYILAYTGRSFLPYKLETIQLQLAVIYYNRLGVEGESRHSEGGIDQAFDSVPPQIIAALNPYRLAKVGFS